MSDQIDAFQFGYPRSCNLCNEGSNDIQNVTLNVEPFYEPKDGFRLMFVGQDPTIYNDPQRVKKVLMLDEPNGQLRRWLNTIFMKEKLDNISIYATNIVKCTFPNPPSTYKRKHFLRPYFENCKSYLIKEIIQYKPDFLMSFGEPAHRYITSLFDESSQISEKMNESFGKGLFEVTISGYKFKYSPSLHITTFRVAEVYGEKVLKFKREIKELFR